MTDNQAGDSYVGYTYQADYALVFLLDCDDSDGVSVETLDDIEIHGSGPTAIQVKHSLKTKQPNLTISNVGLWKTLRIWCSQYRAFNSCRLILVTMRGVNTADSLALLTAIGQDRTQIESDLVAEAKRVVRENEEDKLAKKTPRRHATRIAGCREFLSLSDVARKELLGRIEVRPDTFNAKDITAEVAKRLDPVTKRSKRSSLYERVIEWWHRQVNLSLLQKRPRTIWKDELLSKIDELTIGLDDENLVDDFSRVLPTDADLRTAHGVNLEKQIRLVDGGDGRVKRATLARWRALSQRDRWLNDSLATVTLLQDFDTRLIEEWRALYEPMCEDLVADGANEDEIRKAGRSLLDWSHRDAPDQLPPL
jgi:hypothetical protein